jgi:RND family efflux transporter MFP subunit
MISSDSAMPDKPLSFISNLTSRGKTTKGVLIVIFFVPLILLGRYYFAQLAESHKVKIGPPEPISVRVDAIREEVVAPGIFYSAVVKELRKADLSFRVAGTVDFLHQVPGPGGALREIHEGDKVEKGQILARLDPADYQRDLDGSKEKLAAAEARLKQSESESDLAKIDYDRITRLVARASAATSDLDSQRAKLQSSNAAVTVVKREIEAARISLQQAQANLQYCTLASPFDGAVISTRSVDKFQQVTANQRAFQVLDLSSVVIAFAVPDILVGKLTFGQKIEVTSEALPGKRFDGVIHKIASSADPQNRSYPIEVRIDKPGGLRPGMIASAHFRREEKAFLVPMTAVAPRVSDQATTVFLVTKVDGKLLARQIPVGVVDVLDNKLAIRIGPPDPKWGGLKVGDQIVGTGVHRLHDGDLVRIAE